eukprot:14881306-Alexandrium_andersonii.AAC.1
MRARARARARASALPMPRAPMPKPRLVWSSSTGPPGATVLSSPTAGRSTTSFAASRLQPRSR